MLQDPDVESAVIDYLTFQLAQLGESATVSDVREPGRHVRVILTGGQGRLSVVLSRAQLTLDSYDDRPTLASNLARLVGGLMFELSGTVYGGVQFGAVTEVNTAGNLPDPRDERPRYTQTFIARAKAQDVDT